jgi:NADPH-ferrihemoprotein reductase
MAASLFADLGSNSTLTTVVQQVMKRSGYDDYVVLALLVLGGAGYISRNTLWDKPDPYYYKWFERPQESALKGSAIQKETRNIAQKLEETNRDVVIFWGSQSGTAEGFANRLARDCRRRFKLDALVADLSDYDYDTLMLIPKSKFAIFIMSTYGEGDPSDNSADFLTWLKSSTAISFRSLRYAAFGLGNSNYKYYNKVIDIVTDALNEFGSTPLLPVGKADDASGMTEEDFLGWKDRLCAMFKADLGLQEHKPEYEPSIKVVEDDSMTSIDLHLGEPVPQRTVRKTLAATSTVEALPIKESRELFTQTSSGRSCIHMELDLSHTPEIKYRTGDHLAVWPINPDNEVNRLLKVLGLESRKDIPIHILSLDAANTKVRVPTPTSTRALFQHYLDICGPVSRETAQSLAQFAPSSEAKSLLTTLGTDKLAYVAFLQSHHVTLGRLLEYTGALWSTLPLSFVIESLPPLSPRYYSISSSSIVSPRTAAITAVISNAPLSTTSSVTIPGLTTSYLSALMSSSAGTTAEAALTYPFLKQGTALHAQIRRSTFKLPANALTPLILIAAGTGIAPFRAFLHERARLRAMGRPTGPAILFFGCRNPTDDYLYQSELADLASESQLGDTLTIITAFSRIAGAPKMYVQDRVAEHGVRVCNLLLNDDAGLYICGSANMARDVTKRLGECMKGQQGWTDEKLMMWREKQKRGKRWQEDVWG